MLSAPLGLALIFLCTPPQAQVLTPVELEEALEHLLPDAKRRTGVQRYLNKQLGRAARRPALRARLREQISQNLAAKMAKGFVIDERTIKRTVIDYELFKAKTFISAGVFPKRYFGYFDERWDTAAHEIAMRKTIIAAVKIANALAKERGSPTRITEMEVAVTFIAEGGAILLIDGKQALDRIHPVLGVGLDDIAIGFEKHEKLVRRLDAQLGTRLSEIVVKEAQARRLGRHMDLQEAILGTLVMWVYEKELAAKKLFAKERVHLDKLPVREQFVFASLVYNSGLIFSSERMQMIRELSTGAYMDRLSRRNAKRRWPLPVRAPRSAKQLLLKEGSYPIQPTSWSAVYHILQRYGAYEALRRFGEVFDEAGAYRRRS